MHQPPNRPRQIGDEGKWATALLAALQARFILSLPLLRPYFRPNNSSGVVIFIIKGDPCTLR